jgi:hypothetical protein
MSDEHPQTRWLARWREKRRRKRQRRGDSKEKRAQLYTSRGQVLEAKDAALRPKGGGEGAGGAF